jgi:flagellar hook-associated protein FlgK
MKSTGLYSRAEDTYDLDHEINAQVDRINHLVNQIDTNNDEENKRKILKAMLQTLIEKL